MGLLSFTQVLLRPAIEQDSLSTTRIILLEGAWAACADAGLLVMEPRTAMVCTAAAAALGYCLGHTVGSSQKHAGGPVGSGVRSVAASGAGAGVYESQRAVHEYLQFHYDDTILRGPAATPDAPTEALYFAQRVARVCLRHARPGLRRTALDVGCAVGGSSFELATEFEHVVGIDSDE